MKTEELAYGLSHELNVDTTHVSVQLSLDSAPAEDLEKSAVLYYRLQDESGKEIRLNGKTGISAKYGPFRYIHQKQGQSRYTVEVPVPQGSKVFEAGVASMKQRLRGEVTLTATERGPHTDTDFSRISE